MFALGEAFRTAREARGLTLSDVAEHIHIRSIYLGAIEAEEWATIGAPVYVRGFIRTYARFLGLDAEDAVARFSEMVPGEPPTVSASSAFGSPVLEGSSRERGGPSVFLLAGILVAVLLLGFVGYEYYQYTAGNASQVPVAVASATPAAAESASADASAAATPEPDATPSEAPAAVVAQSGLTIHLMQRSWLRVVVDGKEEMSGVFPAGTYRQFTGSKAYVRAGNAGGVDVSVAGKHLGRLGAAGDVVERSFALGHGEE